MVNALLNGLCERFAEVCQRFPVIRSVGAEASVPLIWNIVPMRWAQVGA
jgi:hypothetical protein